MPMLSLKNLVFLWLLSEVVAFAAVVHVAGWLGAFLLGMATSLLGVVQLRHVGRDVITRLRRTVFDGTGTVGHSDVLLAGMGAVLLIVPGFVSDLIGMSLATSTMRAWLRTRVFAPQADPSSGVLELDPRDWRETSEKCSRLS